MRSPACHVLLSLIVAGPSAGQKIHWNAGAYTGHNALDTAGDFDGDGVDDLVVGQFAATPPRVRVLSSRDGATLVEWLSPSPFGYFGTTVAGPGDLDGDAVPDIAYHRQLPASAGSYHAVAVRSGASGSELYTLHQSSETDFFGYRMAALGDVDGDGRGDLLISAESQSSSASHAGAVHVRSGATGAPLHSIVGTQEWEQLGIRSAALGDCDVDGVPDFAVYGESGSSQRVDVYSGATFAKLHTLTAPSSASAWGWQLAGVGDVDADGGADLALSDIWDSGLAGRVYVHAGASGALIHTVGGSAPGAQFGSSLGAYGDLDGDGRADYLASTLFNTFPSTPTAKYSDVRVLSGASGATLAKFGQLGQFLETFGRALEPIGDLDGDGVREIALLDPPQVWSPLPNLAGVFEFGSGTPGCAGGHGLHANLPAQIPQPGFQLLGDNAPSSGAGFLALSATHNFASANPFGLGVATYALPGTSFLVFPIHADALGDSAAAVPIPNQAGLAGAGLVAQEFWLWLGGPCQSLPLGVSSSRGVFVSLHL
jgi:hypothetical protein